MIDQYDWAGGREQMLRFGPDDGPIVVVALPLFEEANRTRTFAVTLCRALAKQGIASVLPDLAGQGESKVPLDTLSLLRISESYEGTADQFWNAGRRTYGVAIRSGALLDKLGLLHGRWHFAPQDGPDLLRELTRIKQASTGNATRLGDLWYFDTSLPGGAPNPPVEIAGNSISTSLLTDLTVYSPWEQEDGGHVRVVRLETDPKFADRHVAGVPLWRRTEPENDPALAALLAEDIAQWIASCGG